MKYFFILGNNPTLSIAEIFSIVSEIEDYNFLNSDCLVIESKKEINIPKLIQRLGGTIKIGEIRDEASSANYNKIQCVLNNIVQEGKSKFFFGFSYYGKHKFNVKRFAMETKKYLKELNISCRWVISREKTLSSVVVETNKLLTEKGAEIVLIQKGSKILIGKTGAVQDFKALSFRDYDRPARDSKSGMLPPKLAQILINLSGGETEDVILDPFCGSGTVVTEPYLGPQRGKIEIEKVAKELNELYTASITEFYKILKKGGRVAMIWPVFKTGRQDKQLSPQSKGFKTVNMIPEKLKNYQGIKLTDRNTIIYGRDNQRVWREIVVLEKL